MIKRPNLFYFNTTKIILANVLFYFIALIMMWIVPNFINYIALTPSYVLHGKYLWTILTSMFMHGSPFHLFANMVSLLFLGSFLERLIGRKRFFWVYMSSGLVASLFYILFALIFNGDLNMSAVGASGAIFGVAGMLAILTPKMPIYVMFIPIAMPMWFGVILIIAVLWILSATVGLPIGNAAHLGGLLTGVVYAFYLKNKYQRKARLIANHFS